MINQKMADVKIYIDADSDPSGDLGVESPLKNFSGILGGFWIATKTKHLPSASALCLSFTTKKIFYRGVWSEVVIVGMDLAV